MEHKQIFEHNVRPQLVRESKREHKLFTTVSITSCCFMALLKVVVGVVCVGLPGGHFKDRSTQ